MAEPTKLETIETKLKSIPTDREEPIISNHIDSLQTFQLYSVVEQLPSKGAESDIYIIEKESQKYILKLYRYGIEPKKEILDKLYSLSQKYPKDLVKIYKTGYDEVIQRWFEIQEYLQNGSLKEFKEQIDTEKLYEIIEEILSILNTLHTNKIIHRDIKPENILIRSYTPLDLVITDFGISSLLDDATNIWTNRQGTYQYFAPESFAGVIGKAVDYWSLGMIIYELANGGRHYFDGISNESTIQLHITTKEVEIPSSFDENIRQLLGFLFRINPEYRGDYTLIKKWLDGEDIGEPKPNEEPIELQDGYPFDGKKYNDFRALAKTVSRNYKNWVLWGDHLENQHVLDWAETYKQYDKHTLLQNIRDYDQDLMVLRFIYTFNREIKEFRLFGKAITLNNLHLFTQNYLNNRFLDEEERIYKSLVSGEIKRFYSEYLRLSQTENRYGWVFDEIEEYIKQKGEDGLSRRVIFKFLEFVANQDDYLLPSDKTKINIHNFNHFIKKEELQKNEKISQQIIDSLDDSKKLKKLMAIKIEEYYYPNDFFENLEKEFSDTLYQVEFFVKKSNIENIEKRYYIPNNSPYTDYIQKIKNSSSDSYLQAHSDLKAFKRETLLLRNQLEEAKEKKELFEQYDIDIENPLTYQLKKIKRIVRSNIDLETYQNIKTLNREKIYGDLVSYISKIETLNMQLMDKDKKIVHFIKNYRWKLNSARAIFLLSLISILVAVPFYRAYLISFVFAFALVILLYILTVSQIVKIPISYINQIGKVAKKRYKTKEELPNKLIVLDNFLVRFIVWTYTILLGGWIIYAVIIIPLIKFFKLFMDKVL
jgi:serine/threonine protein kinase